MEEEEGGAAADTLVSRCEQYHNTWKSGRLPDLPLFCYMDTGSCFA
ncbi:hypothetical protein ACFL3H_02290 [Gemmatimonadota bacterium]